MHSILIINHQYYYTYSIRCFLKLNLKAGEWFHEVSMMGSEQKAGQIDVLRHTFKIYYMDDIVRKRYFQLF